MHGTPMGPTPKCSGGGEGGGGLYHKLRNSRSGECPTDNAATVMEVM